METLLDWIGGGTLGVIIVAVVGWLLGRRKAGAEVRALEASTTAEMLKTSRDLRQEMAQALELEQTERAKVAKSLEEHIEADIKGKALRATAYKEHQSWDEELASACREAGIPISDPPPLHEEG